MAYLKQQTKKYSAKKSKTTIQENNDGTKNETRKYFRTYEVKFGEQINMKGDSKVFESSIVVDEKVKKKV